MPLTDLALIAGLRAGGADAEYFSADIRVDDDARGLVDRTVARFGSLDIAVNAAGARQLRGALTEQTVEAYAETFDTTVLGTMLSLKHELRVMLAGGSDSIIDLASVASRSGVANAPLHATSKSAVDGLTKSAALECGTSSIRVNAVAAPLTPGGGSAAEAGNRWAATLEETARTIAFLGSDGAACLNGQSVLVGGAHAPPREPGVYDAAPGTVY